MASNTQRSSFSALLQRHWDNPVVDRLAPFGYTTTAVDYNDGSHDTYHNISYPDPADGAFNAVSVAVSAFNTANPTHTISVNTSSDSFRSILGVYAAHQGLLDWTNLYSTRQTDNSPAIINLVGLAGGLNLQLENLNLDVRPADPANNIPVGTTPYIASGSHTPAIERLAWVDKWSADMIGTVDRTFVDMPVYNYTNAASQLMVIKLSPSWVAYTNAMVSIAADVATDVGAIPVPGAPATIGGTPSIVTSTDAANYQTALAAVVGAYGTTITTAVNAIAVANPVEWEVLTTHRDRLNAQVTRERIWWNWVYERNNGVPYKKSPGALEGALSTPFPTYTTAGSPFPDFTTIGLIAKAASLSQTLDTVKANPDEATKIMFTEMHSHPGNANAAAVITGLAETVVR